MREFSVQFRDVTKLLCQDDKHTVKVGEPDLPVAAVEQGKQVSDNDFTKFSITPSVTRKSGHSGQVGSFHLNQVLGRYLQS